MTQPPLESDCVAGSLTPLTRGTGVATALPLIVTGFLVVSVAVVAWAENHREPATFSCVST